MPCLTSMLNGDECSVRCRSNSHQLNKELVIDYSDTACCLELVRG